MPPKSSVAAFTTSVPVLVKPALAISSVAPLLTESVPWLAKLPAPPIVSVPPAVLAVMVPWFTTALV